MADINKASLKVPFAYTKGVVTFVPKPPEFRTEPQYPEISVDEEVAIFLLHNFSRGLMNYEAYSLMEGAATHWVRCREIAQRVKLYPPPKKAMRLHL